MAERHSEFARAYEDFYVEPAWCVERLLERYPGVTQLHDPCCGSGTIVDTAHRRGVFATGADCVDRAGGRFRVTDFLQDDHAYPAIVTNPPFKSAEAIVTHALGHVAPGGIVAAIAQVKFLASRRRHTLFCRLEMERVLVLSRRPSMPPGDMLAALGEACRGGGSIDFVWCVWRAGKQTLGSTIEWTI